MPSARNEPRVVQKNAPKLEAACDLLFKRLDGKPDGVPYVDLKRETEAMGISDEWLSVAGYALGVVRKRLKIKGLRGRQHTVWTLPELPKER